MQGVAIDDVQILAWLDGQLDDATDDAIERALQADPALMARAERYFLTMMRIKTAFAPLLDAPLPDLRPTATSPSRRSDDDKAPQAHGDAPELPLASAHPADLDRSWSPEPPQLAVPGRRLANPPLVSSRPFIFVIALLLGLGLGRYFFAASHLPPVASLSGGALPQSGDIRDRQGSLVAAGTLAEMLEHGLSGDTKAPVRIALSFRDKTGRMCRSFDTAQLAGIACREDDGWHLPLALQIDSDDSTRAAASESPMIGEAVNALIAGDPLDSGQERRARDRNWR